MKNKIHIRNGHKDNKHIVFNFYFILCFYSFSSSRKFQANEREEEIIIRIVSPFRYILSKEYQDKERL